MGSVQDLRRRQPPDAVRAPEAGHGTYDATKRLLDLVSAVVALVLLSPVTGLVAIAVRLRMGRPVLFRQERAGRYGRPFTILKFRTMDLVDSTCCRTPEACLGPQYPPGRTTSRLGQVLRRSGLDELPQLVNVVRGEMSWVGPRPLLVRYVGRYNPEQRRRLQVRPGMTGWAQVHGRTEAPWADRLAMDVWYVDHRSLQLDLRIAARTVRILAASVARRSSARVDVEFLGDGPWDGSCPAEEDLETLARRRPPHERGVIRRTALAPGTRGRSRS